MNTQIPNPGMLSFERSQIESYLKQLKFKPRLFGVDQADVWQKLEELNRLYETALLAQQHRYEELLRQAQAGNARPEPDPDFWKMGEGMDFDSFSQF